MQPLLLAAAVFAAVHAQVHRSGVVVLNEGEAIQFERNLLKYLEKYLYPVKLQMRMQDTPMHCYAGIPSTSATPAAASSPDLLPSVCALLSADCTSAKLDAPGDRVEVCPCRSLSLTQNNRTSVLWQDASAERQVFNHSISLADLFDTVIFDDYVITMAEVFARLGYDDVLTVTVEGRKLQGYKVYNNLLRLQTSTRLRKLTRGVQVSVAGKHSHSHLLSQVVQLRGLIGIGKNDAVIFKHLPTDSLLVSRVLFALNKNFYYLDVPVDLSSLVLMTAIRDDLMKHYDIGDFDLLNCTIAVADDVVVGSTDCKDLESLADGKVVVVGHQMRTFVFPVASSLVKGTQASSQRSANLYYLKPSSYLTVKRGYSSPKPAAPSEMPALIQHSLDLWSIDTSISHPQYMTNPYLSLQSNNLILLALTKLHQHNNLRILLHRGDDPFNEDSQLFFVDVDENNNVYVSNIKTGKNMHGSYSGDGHTVGLALYLTQTGSLVVCNSFVECDVPNVLLIFEDEDLAQVAAVNINQLDTYSISLDFFAIKRQLLPKVELYASMLRSAGFAHVQAATVLPSSLQPAAGSEPCSHALTFTCDPASKLFLEVSGKDPCRLALLVRSNLLCRKGKHAPMNFDSTKTVCLIDNERNLKIIQNIDRRIDRLYNSIADK